MAMDDLIMDETYDPFNSDVCWDCRHFNHIRAQDYEGDIIYACSAFPQGIPREIWRGKHRHRTPFPGDEGIQFEEKTPEEQEKEAMDHLHRRMKEYGVNYDSLSREEMIEILREHVMKETAGFK